MRWLAALLVVAALSTCNGGSSGPGPIDHRVIIVDRGGPLRLLSSDGETLVDLGDCDSCSSPVVAPDGRTLYIVQAVRTGTMREGTYSYGLFDSKVLTVDITTGSVSTGPAFSNSPLPWSWGSPVISPDGRYLYLDIPHNPANVNYNLLHAHRGYAAYDLREQRLLEKPFISLPPGEASGTMHLAPDGRQAYICCWVQGPDHPHPGVTTTDLSTGETVAKAMILSPSHLVHPTRLAPAGDGRHFYALRAGSDAWWELDAQAGVITRAGAAGLVEAPRPSPTGGRYEVAAGEMVASPAKGLLFSSLYLAEADRTSPAPPKHKDGGGIQVYRTKDFTRAANLFPERTFEALALSPNQAILYALDTEAGELLAFNTQSLKPAASLKGLGTHPIEVLILPSVVDK